MLATLISLSFAFDHDHRLFARFLDGAASEAGVDYALLATRRTLLDEYLSAIATADPTGFTDAQKLAFYVNAYNACTLSAVLSAGPPASIRDLDGGAIWSTRTFLVAGSRSTLDQLEHGHARKLADGRVHAVVNCASKGCPPLPPTPLVAEGIDRQLDDAARRWARVNGYRRDGATVRLSSIFDWYAQDFASVKAERDLPGVEGSQEQAIWFLARFLEEPERGALLSVTGAGWAEYDWSLNAR